MTVAASSSSSSSRGTLAHHRALLVRVASRRQRRSTVVSPSDRRVPTLAVEGAEGRGPAAADDVDLTAIPPAKRAKVEVLYPCYRWDEETVRNDLPARYGQTGEWGGSFIAGADEARRFDEYPRSKRLLRLKKELFARLAHPPLFLPLAPLGPAVSADECRPVPASITEPEKMSRTTPLAALPASRPVPLSETSPAVLPFNAHLLATLGQTHFDTVVVTPPAGLGWAEIATLPIRQLTADPSFVYLWVGEGGADGLEKGRETLARWGFRRCEEIVWVKTGRASAKGSSMADSTGSIFANTKEHCLMGIRGTVRRSVDGRLVHTNIDTDIIVWAGDPQDPHAKPPELLSLAENFSMGTRRLDLFGSQRRPRQGWVTAGWEEPASEAQAPSLSSDSQAGGPSLVERLESLASAAETSGLIEPEVRPLADGIRLFDKDAYEALVRIDGRYLYPTPEEVENLRPKSPVRNGSGGPSRPHSSQFSSGGSGAPSSGHRPYVPIAVSSVPGFASLPLPPRPMGTSNGMSLQTQPRQQQQQQQRQPPPQQQQQQQLGHAVGNHGGTGVDAYPAGMAMGGMMPFPGGSYGLPMMPMGAFFQPTAFGMGMVSPQAGMMGMQGMYSASSYGGGGMQQQQQYQPFYQQGSMPPSMPLPQTSMPRENEASTGFDDSSSTSSSSSSPPPPPPSVGSVAFSYSYDRPSSGWGGPR